LRLHWYHYCRLHWPSIIAGSTHDISVAVMTYLPIY
jgi:hypothetical protein